MASARESLREREDETSHQLHPKRMIQAQTKSIIEINNAQIGKSTLLGPLEPVFSHMHMHHRVFSVDIADLPNRLFKTGYGSQMYENLITVRASSEPVVAYFSRTKFSCTSHADLVPESQRHPKIWLMTPIDSKEKTLVIVNVSVYVNANKTYETKIDTSNHVICVIFYRMSIKDDWEASLFDANHRIYGVSEKNAHGRSSFTHNGVIPGAEEVMNIISKSVLGFKVKWRIGQLGLHDKTQMHSMILGRGICYFITCVIIALMSACNSEPPTNGGQLMQNVNRALDNINNRPGALCQIIENIYLGQPIPPWVCLKGASDQGPISFAHWMRSTVTGHSGTQKRALSRVKTNYLKAAWEKAQQQRSTKKPKIFKQSTNIQDKGGARRFNIPAHLQRLKEEEPPPDLQSGPPTRGNGPPTRKNGCSIQ
jgi:hypothetical protein